MSTGMGDMNSRIGSENNLIDSFNDDIQVRMNIDTNINDRGRSLLDRGRAVVDYMIARQADMHLFREFKISTMNEIADVVKHFISDKCRIPDHSILVCNVLIS